MKKTTQSGVLLAAVLAAFTASVAHADGNALFRAEQACIKYSGPAAQDDCRRRQKEAMEAFDREQAQKKQQDAATTAAPQDAAPAKKSGLCFLREGTGEQVCPN